MGSEDGTRYVISGDPPDTVRILAEMGRDMDETPHYVGLNNGFYLGKAEITNQEFVEAGNWAIANNYATTTETAMYDAMDGSTVELINFDFPGTPIKVNEDGTLRLDNGAESAHPVIELTWFGAAAYCDWLSLQEGLDPAYDHSDWTVGGGDFYSAEGYRLPTEAEWEYACRAGTQTAFWSGDIETGSCTEQVLDGAAWYCGNAGSTSHAVATKAANSWGLFDTHGNVWEWCHDHYGRYEIPEPDPDNPDDIVYVIDPIGPEDGEFRCIRGGRWLLSSTLCRSAARMMADPGFKGINIGFRVAQTDIR
jgi:formylglycine-generating enzyme required for sulfatase activity